MSELFIIEAAIFDLFEYHKRLNKAQKLELAKAAMAISVVRAGFDEEQEKTLPDIEVVQQIIQESRKKLKSMLENENNP